MRYGADTVFGVSCSCGEDARGVVWWLRHGISAFVQRANGQMVHEWMCSRLLSVTAGNADRQWVILFL